jgi:hypothetical protein
LATGFAGVLPAGLVAVFAAGLGLAELVPLFAAGLPPAFAGDVLAVGGATGGTTGLTAVL